MTQDDLARVRDNLETINSAIGLPPRWDPREVRINLLLAAAGLAAMVWALLPHTLSPLLGLCLFAVPVIEWLRAGKAGESHMVGREFRGALRTLWLALPIVALFYWCRQVGLSPLEFLGLATFLIGAVLFSASVSEPLRGSLVGWAAALMIGGWLLPMGFAPVVAVLCWALASGGIISAALVYAAREESTSHAAG